MTKTFKEGTIKKVLEAVEKSYVKLFEKASLDNGMIVGLSSHDAHNFLGDLEEKLKTKK